MRGEHLKKCINDITKEVFDLWWEHARNGTLAAVDHLTQALPALAQTNGNYQGKPLLSWLCERLKDTTDLQGERLAAQGLIAMGPAAVQEDVLQAMLETLRQNNDPELCRRVCYALSKMGKIAAQRTMLQALLHVGLQAKDELVRHYGAEALGILSAEARQLDRIEVLQALLQTLNPFKNSKLCWFATGALRTMGRATDQTVQGEVRQALLRTRDQAEDNRSRWFFTQALITLESRPPQDGMNAAVALSNGVISSIGTDTISMLPWWFAVQPSVRLGAADQVVQATMLQILLDLSLHAEDALAHRCATEALRVILQDGWRLFEQNGELIALRIWKLADGERPSAISHK